jgi:hypothetical protein
MTTNIHINPTLVIDPEVLTHQRAMLVALVERFQFMPTIMDSLHGTLNLLDAISDAAEADGWVSDDDISTWWAEGCIAAGLGDPRLDNESPEM